MIYAYEDKYDPNLRGLLKVGYTTIGVQERVRQQYNIVRPGEPPYRILVDDRLYFGCGTFKNVFRQLTANPRVEVLALNGSEFLRYDGLAKVVRDDGLLAKVREAMPQIMALYDKNGWEMGLFYLENGHAEIRGMLDLKEEFDV